VVVPGDNLWKIASRTLETLDKERIADYWVRIYRHNRDLIGPDPNLVRPGQVLDLPEV
jgi:nucleoid-associated protein YgaU